MSKDPRQPETVDEHRRVALANLQNMPEAWGTSEALAVATIAVAHAVLALSAPRSTDAGADTPHPGPMPEQAPRIETTRRPAPPLGFDGWAFILVVVAVILGVTWMVTR